MKNTESVRVDIKTRDLLREVKEKQGITISAAIRIAVEEKYGKEKK